MVGNTCHRRRVFYLRCLRDMIGKMRYGSLHLIHFYVILSYSITPTEKTQFIHNSIVTPSPLAYRLIGFYLPTCARPRLQPDVRRRDAPVLRRVSRFIYSYSGCVRI